jgi:hypothetical protein
MTIHVKNLHRVDSQANNLSRDQRERFNPDILHSERLAKDISS